MGVSDTRRMNLKVGLAIRMWRKARGLSQEMLAIAADVDLGYLRQMERGAARADAAAITQIAIALDCGVVDFFISGVAPENPPPPKDCRRGE